MNDCKSIKVASKSSSLGPSGILPLQAGGTAPTLPLSQHSPKATVLLKCHFLCEATGPLLLAHQPPPVSASPIRGCLCPGWSPRHVHASSLHSGLYTDVTLTEAPPCPLTLTLSHITALFRRACLARSGLYRPPQTHAQHRRSAQQTSAEEITKCELENK